MAISKQTKLSQKFFKLVKKKIIRFCKLSNIILNYHRCQWTILPADLVNRLFFTSKINRLPITLNQITNWERLQLWNGFDFLEVQYFFVNYLLNLFLRQREKSNISSSSSTTTNQFSLECSCPSIQFLLLDNHLVQYEQIILIFNFPFLLLLVVVVYWIRLFVSSK